MATTDIDEVLSRLDAVIARAIENGDRSGYFAVLYRKVTAKVKEGIEADFFDDTERMGRLDALFAERYFEAVAARDAGDEPTASWQLTFVAARRRRPLVLQHLLAGINAHINLDLGIAAARCSPGDELPDLRRDFDRINAVLASVVGAIQEDLQRISPWMGLLDRFGARTQTELIRFSIITARAGAWRFATQLATTPESRWASSIEERDRRVTRVGEQVLRPGPLMGAGLLLVRLRERQDVAADLALLLGSPEPALDTIESNVEEPTIDG